MKTSASTEVLSPTSPTPTLDAGSAITLRWTDGVSTCAGHDPGILKDLVLRKDTFVWIDLQGLGESDISSILQPLAFHHLALEDAVQPTQRPKIDEFDDHFFLVAHEVSQAEDGGIHTQQIGVFVKANAVVTVHKDKSEALTWLCARCDHRNTIVHRGADFFLYNLLDTLVDRYFPIIESLDDRIDDLEDRIVQQPRRDLLDEIFTLKRILIHLRKIAGPTREVLTMLTTRDYPAIRPEMMPYFRDVSDHLIRIYEILDSYRDLMSGALDAYLSNISNMLNLVMQRLTIITVIFLPLTFVTGIFGMNFKTQPWEFEWDRGQVFWGVTVFMAVLGTGMYWWFHRKRLL